MSMTIPEVGTVLSVQTLLHYWMENSVVENETSYCYNNYGKRYMENEGCYESIEDTTQRVYPLTTAIVWNTH